MSIYFIRCERCQVGIRAGRRRDYCPSCKEILASRASFFLMTQWLVVMVLVGIALTLLLTQHPL